MNLEVQIVILTTSMLLDKYKNYVNPQSKIRRLVERKELFPLTRGLYETDSDAPGYCLAQAIYGPSYISFDYALAYYDLIPETVYTFSSATFGKRKIKEYDNHFGRFTYRDVPNEAYPPGIIIKEEEPYIYKIACPEKALCDKLYTMPPVTSQKEIEKMIFDDLRIEKESLLNMDINFILEIGDKYHSNNLKYLMKYFRRKSL